MWSGTGFEINLTFIRHGHTEGNLEHRYIGRTEEGLCKEGREALEKNKEKFMEPEYVFVSPMLRCVESAKILFPGMEYMEISEWKEMDFGAFEGKNYQELQGNLEYQKWIDSNGILPFPGGENREDFITRVKKGFYRMVEILKEEEKDCYNVSAVVHGGTIMALLSAFHGGEYFDYQVKNAEGYQCHIGCGQDNKYRWKVRKL